MNDHIHYTQTCVASSNALYLRRFHVYLWLWISEQLKGMFGEGSGPLVVMLQEVCCKSLQVILENSWVQQNFVLSNVNPPESLYTDIPGKSFIMKRLDWRAAPYLLL